MFSVYDMGLLGYIIKLKYAVHVKLRLLAVLFDKHQSSWESYFLKRYSTLSFFINLQMFLQRPNFTSKKLSQCELPLNALGVNFSQSLEI